MATTTQPLLPSQSDSVDDLFRATPALSNEYSGVAPASAASAASAVSVAPAIAAIPPPRPQNTLTEPVSVTLQRDVQRVWVNLRCVLVPSERSSLRDWDLWGPFFFIITLALLLSSSATHNKAHVFAVVFGTVSTGAVVLTLNVQLLGGRIIFFQSLSLLGYCLVPLDLAALLCLLTTGKLVRMALVLVTFAWSSSAAYPFVAKAVPETRRALAVYPVFLLYTAIGFLVLAND
ncbi:unnamed protein product [Closterium sp. NIES-53]